MKLKLKKTDINKAEREIIKRIEEIVFDTKRRTAKKEIKGRYGPNRYVIDDLTGDLRASIKRNKGFIILDERGENIQLDLSFVEHYLYLDEGTKKMKPWMLSDYILNDEKIQEIVGELLEKGFEQAIINIFNDNFD